MNIFVGFGYNNDDLWIKDLIFPLIKYFEGTVITGEDLHGEVISQECVDRIKTADGVFAFLTRRDTLPNGKFTTHRWVTDELSVAISNSIPAIEIRDIQVDVPGGLPGDRQRIVFDLNKKELLLIELAKVLCNWRRRFIPRRLFLLPEIIVKDVRPYIRKGGIQCSYQFRQGNRETTIYYTKPFPFGQGLCVDVFNVPSDDALIQVILSGPDLSWSSSFVSVQLLSIHLERD